MPKEVPRCCSCSDKSLCEESTIEIIPPNRVHQRTFFNYMLHCTNSLIANTIFCFPKSLSLEFRKYPIAGHNLIKIEIWEDPIVVGNFNVLPSFSSFITAVLSYIPYIFIFLVKKFPKLVFGHMKFHIYIIHRSSKHPLSHSPDPPHELWSRIIPK